MTELLQEYHLAGFAIGLCTFPIIGMFHPIVIKCEYHFGTGCWPVLLLAGIAALAGSFLVGDVALAALLGVFAFSSFWSIKELFEQEERVRKGWFPRNPKRTKQKTERHEP